MYNGGKCAMNNATDGVTVGQGPSNYCCGLDLNPHTLSGTNDPSAERPCHSNATHERLRVGVEADKPDDQPTITAVRCVVTVELKEHREKLQCILDKRMSTCPVGKLYEKAETSMDIRLELKGVEGGMLDPGDMACIP
jgi:hypothetical protein